ncbi:MAG: Rrf2 family transcriptional regulator [Oscillospiraceae bacterium]|nr:Rrf2 family transcriptional regulator [Oscillospiraceae bacterium]
MHISTRCSIALHCLIFIQEYGGRKRVTSELLSLSAGCNPVTIRGILSALRKAGILSAGSGAGGAVLACPPEQVSLCRVWMAVEPDMLAKLIGMHGAPSPLCPVGRHIHAVLDRSYGKIRGDLKASLESVTLADIMADYRRAALE